ncbi:MAG: hypothetical protein ACI841_002473, partial [Planctomycetota bacterium]
MAVGWRFGSGSKQGWRALALLPITITFGPIG